LLTESLNNPEVLYVVLNKIESISNDAWRDDSKDIGQGDTEYSKEEMKLILEKVLI